MTTVLLTIHLFVTLALIGVVLIQRSEGGGLGIGTSQGMGGFMSGRGTANLLTRTTAILGTVFFVLSLTLALLNRGTVGVGRSLLDNPPAATTSAPASTGTVPGRAIPGSAVPGSETPATGAPSGSAVPGTAAPAAPGAVVPGASSVVVPPATTGTAVLPEPPAGSLPESQTSPAPGTTPEAPAAPAK